MKGDHIQASVPAPVASLPPRQPIPSVHFSMARSVHLSMAIDSRVTGNRITARNHVTSIRTARSAILAVRTDPMSSSRNGRIAVVKGGNPGGPFRRFVRGFRGASSKCPPTDRELRLERVLPNHSQVACWRRASTEEGQAQRPGGGQVVNNTTMSRSEIVRTVQSPFLRRVLSWWVDGADHYGTLFRRIVRRGHYRESGRVNCG